MNSFAIVFLAAVACASAGLLPSAKILQGPSTRTTVVGPDGSAISAVAPGGQIVHEESVGVVAHSAPVLAAAPVVASYAAPAVAAYAAPAVHAAPVAVAHAAPVVAHAAPVVAHAAPVAVGARSTVSEQSSLVRHTPEVVETVSHVAAPVAVAHAAPVAYSAPVAVAHAAPVAYAAHAAPVAVAHAAPVAYAAHAAPVAVAHAAPVVAHSALTAAW